MEITNNQDQVVPMFLSQQTEQPMAHDAKTHNNMKTEEPQLSVFDVKELYDLAYNEKAKGTAGESAFKTLLAEAVKLDMMYRRQLAKMSSYQDKSQINKFQHASRIDRVA